MSCYHPLQGWLSREVNPTGKRSIVFNAKDGCGAFPVSVPCGNCIGCRLDKARSWTQRIVQEASLYQENCFITLTYDPETVPEDGSLRVDHFQSFMKRFRDFVRRDKAFRSLYPDLAKRKIRFFNCGEYGVVCGNCSAPERFCSCGRFIEALGRPHFHVILFNFDFPDKVRFGGSDRFPIYRSAILEYLWDKGFSTIADVTKDSAAYVSGYIIKKQKGDTAEEYYSGLKPEFITMSRRPGIASAWYDKFKSDVFPHDYILEVGGFKAKPSKYFEEKYHLTDEINYYKIKSSRKKKAFKSIDNTPTRLRAREACDSARLSLKKRGYENGAKSF